MSRLTIFSDGASKGNPGDAGIGVVIADENGEVIREISEYIGKTTNNAAEYQALIRGLQEAKRLGADELRISTDSELMARQLSGTYKVKSELLKPLYGKAVTLLRGFSKIGITHVMRELNERADKLANDAVKKHRNDAAGRNIDRPHASGSGRRPKQKTLDL